MDSNPNIKWCPFPGCGRAVKLPDLEDRVKKAPADTSRAVDCGNGHYFCWYYTIYFTSVRHIIIAARLLGKIHLDSFSKAFILCVKWLVMEVDSLKFLFILTGLISGHDIHVSRNVSIVLLLLVFVLSN